MTFVLPHKTESVPLWRQIQRKNFTRVEKLLDFLEFSEERRQSVLPNPRFVLNLPQRLAAKMGKNTIDDPLFRQFVPLQDELIPTPGFVADPVADQTFRKTKKILHKYNSRALVIASGACAMHCRYCFRQNFPYETAEKTFDTEISYLQENTSLSEVILSGGDPLSLSNETLATLIQNLDSIPHLKRIRFHTRFPIGIPERIDPALLALLASSSKQIFFIVHINHAQELDAEVVAALRSIRCLGIPVLNQSVLLKGVNDDEKILLALSNALVNAGIIPYYLNLLDPVQGAGHFNVPQSRGLELIDHLEQNLSGYGVPRLIREIPGKPSKTHINS